MRFQNLRSSDYKHFVKFLGIQALPSVLPSLALMNKSSRPVATEKQILFMLYTTRILNYKLEINVVVL